MDRDEYEKKLINVLEIIGEDLEVTTEHINSIILLRALKHSWKKSVADTFNKKYNEIDSDFKLRKLMTILKTTSTVETLILMKREELGDKKDEYIEEEELFEQLLKITNDEPVKESKVIMVKEWDNGKIVGERPEVIIIDRYPTPSEKIKATTELHKRNYFTQAEKKRFDIQDKQDNNEENNFLADISIATANFGNDVRIDTLQAENGEVDLFVPEETVEDMDDFTDEE